MAVDITKRPTIPYGRSVNDSDNMFRDAFGRQSDGEWLQTLIRSVSENEIAGIPMLGFPDETLQSYIHGSGSTEHSLREAFAFYQYARRYYSEAGIDDNAYYLDFGCGWGRITRLFMRDFKLRNIYGFEPDLFFAAIARSLNPFVTVLTGDFLPEGVLPRDRFELIVSWSVFSHLSERSARPWLAELAAALAPGGLLMFTTWGKRFIDRLAREEAALARGEPVHWHPKSVLEACGGAGRIRAEYEKGDFVWFAMDDSTLFGQALMSEPVIRSWIAEARLPLELLAYDTAELAQDAIVLRKNTPKRVVSAAVRLTNAGS